MTYPCPTGNDDDCDKSETGFKVGYCAYLWSIACVISLGFY